MLLTLALTAEPLDLSLGYEDVAIVAYARTTARLDERVLAALADPTVPLDVKAAVIGGVAGRGGEPLDVSAYAGPLAARLGVPEKKLWTGKVATLPPTDAFVLGVLQVGADPLRPERAVQVLGQAAEGLPQSLTVRLYASWARGEAGADMAGCAAWREFDQTVEHFSGPVDLRPRALATFTELAHAHDCP